MRRSISADWYCIPLLVTRWSNFSKTLPALSNTVKGVGLYQVDSMSIQPSVPITTARLFEAMSKAQSRSACCPSAYSKIAAVCRSTPVAVMEALARMVSGMPRTSMANETG